MKKLLFIAGSLVVVAIIGVIIFFQWSQAMAVETFKSSQASFNYPSDYKKAAPAQAAQNKHAEALARLIRPQPLGIIELNYEKGAIIGANMSKANFLDTLEKNAKKILPLTHKKYKELGNQRVKINGRDGAQIDFSYLGKDKKTTLYMTVLLLPKGNDALYLQVQSSDHNQWIKDVAIIKKNLRF